MADEPRPSTYHLDLDDASPRRSSRRREERRQQSRRRAVRAGALIALGVPSLLASFVVGWNVLGGGGDVTVRQAALPASSRTTDPADGASTPISGPKVAPASKKPSSRTTSDGASRETNRKKPGSTTSTTTSSAPAAKTSTTTSTKPKPAPSSSSTSKKPAGTGSSSSSAEAEVLRLVNVERAKVGCNPLKANSTLAAVAQAHSKDMAVNGYFDHNSQNGTTPFQRMSKAGYSYSYAAENIAAGQQTPESVMGSWMNSPGHKANILNCNLTELGVGVWTESGSPYGIYWTQDFGTPR